MSWFNFGANAASSGVALWRELTVFSAYRLFLASMLCLIFFVKVPPGFLGAANPDLYAKASIAYVVFAMLFVITTLLRLGVFVTQTRLQLVLDIVFLTLIINASGGIATGLGSLLVVVVVAGGALIPGRLSAFIAAMATLSVLLEVSYAQIAGDGMRLYTHAGMLGATFFATALLAQTLSKKMKTTLKLADERGENVSKLALLNQHIISSMQTGVIVVDSKGLVTLSNHAAQKMLGITYSTHAFSLLYLVPILAEQLKKWRQDSLKAFESIRVRPDLPEVTLRFTAMDSGETLIYIDNISTLEQQAQQLKLASLGRLTASIAHEIRNPLGAISHAGELLAESCNNDPIMTKLTDIIQRHSARVNGIIETILNMSRRKIVEPKVVILALWLESFIKEFCEAHHVDNQDIDLTVTSSFAKVKMDEQQLHQVMANLLENALHYSVPEKGKARVTITVSIRNNNVMLDVSDNGQGISEEIRQNLFEPFHSDRQGGTGLGLYLARELCQANGAQLKYIEQEHGCCFRVILPIEKQETLH